MALYLENCKSNQERSILEHNCSFWMKTLFQIFEVNKKRKQPFQISLINKNFNLEPSGQSSCQIGALLFLFINSE